MDANHKGKSGFPAQGRLVIGDEGPRWEGPLLWSIDHKSGARSTWSVGKLRGVQNVLLPDGARSSIIRRGDPETGLWRRHDGVDTWIHGTLKITPDDVEFVDAFPQPRPRRWRAGTIAGDMARHPEVLDAVAVDELAWDIYGALCSLGWRNASGKEYWGTWRQAGEIVASLRGRGECRTDFFLVGTEGIVTDRVLELFGKIGWSLIGTVNFESRRRRAMGILVNCEARLIGETPDWYADWAHGLSYTDTPYSRIHLCALTGRVSFEEWQAFWECIDEPGG